MNGEVGLDQWDWLYHEQHRNPRTPVTTLFFSLPNLHWLTDQISLETGRLLNLPVQVAPDNEMFCYLETLLKGAPNLLDTVAEVQTLNLMAFRHEVGVQYRSVRRRALFNKWFVLENRPRTIEPPLLTQGRHREVGLDLGAYALRNPDARYWNDFRLKQQLAETGS